MVFVKKLDLYLEVILYLFYLLKYVSKSWVFFYIGKWGLYLSYFILFLGHELTYRLYFKLLKGWNKTKRSLLKRIWFVVHSHLGWSSVPLFSIIVYMLNRLMLRALSIGLLEGFSVSRSGFRSQLHYQMTLFPFVKHLWRRLERIKFTVLTSLRCSALKVNLDKCMCFQVLMLIMRDSIVWHCLWTRRDWLIAYIGFHFGDNPKVEPSKTWHLKRFEEIRYV